MNARDPHLAAWPPWHLLDACDVTFTRRSGPGGQNRNKVETAVILRHPSSGLSAEASERRTQGENREAALFRLRLKMALELRSDFEGPGPLWTSRCRGGRVSINPGHEDFPALLAEALDALHHHEDDSKAASEALGCSASQLIKLLKEEPRALSALNDRRKRRGLRPLL